MDLSHIKKEFNRVLVKREINQIIISNKIAQFEIREAFSKHNELGRIFLTGTKGCLHVEYMYVSNIDKL